MSPDETGRVINRMQLVPDISCDSDFYAQIYFMAIIPATCIYCVLFPLFTMRQVMLSSHWIFHSNRDRSLLEVEEKWSVATAKSHFGFYFVGFSTGQLLKREITDSDYPIENSGTFSKKNMRSPFKICCQVTKETLLTYLVYPLTAHGMLVRISPDHVNKSFFYWELVMYIEKLILIALLTRFTPNIADAQLVVAIIVVAAFL